MIAVGHRGCLTAGGVSVCYANKHFWYQCSCKGTTVIALGRLSCICHQNQDRLYLKIRNVAATRLWERPFLAPPLSHFCWQEPVGQAQPRVGFPKGILTAGEGETSAFFFQCLSTCTFKSWRLCPSVEQLSCWPCTIRNLCCGQIYYWEGARR